MKLPVTYLFVPGNRPERFDKALAADAVRLDGKMIDRPVVLEAQSILDRAAQ